MPFCRESTPWGLTWGATATVDLELQITTLVADPEDVRTFLAELHVVGIDGLTCSGFEDLPPECEFLLATTVFAPDEIEVRTQPTSAIKTLDLALSGPGVSALDEFIGRQRIADRSVHVLVTLDTEGAFPDDPNPQDNFGISGGLQLLPLSGDLWFGNIRAQLLDYQGQAHCVGDPGLRVTGADVVWTPGSAGNWPPRSLQLDSTHCVELMLSPDNLVDLHLTQGSLSVTQVKGTFGGLAGFFDNVILNGLGRFLSDLTIILPDNTSFHQAVSATGGPRPRGTGTLVIDTGFSPAPPDFDTASFHVDLSDGGQAGFLQAAGLPFTFEVAGAVLNINGLEGDWIGIRYLYDVAFSQQDTRHFRGAPSNDFRYRHGAEPSSSSAGTPFGV
ncbi:MAG: hypothetical protein GY703_24480 [Gammaproteobacteria bacterium]|nr:hypothetical protein [Gammaproteobacteria bacterium]